jgi:hypothetical protein
MALNPHQNTVNNAARIPITNNAPILNAISVLNRSFEGTRLLG